MSGRLAALRLPGGLSAGALAGLLTALVAGAPGCGGAPAEGPPDVAYGLDACARCRMIISEPRHAAARVSADGDAALFDDIGCMVRFLAQEEAGGATLWVHHHGGEGWLRAESATYVETPGLPTPMGYGLAAFPGPSEAERFSAEGGGRVLTWDDLSSETATDALEARD